MSRRGRKAWGEWLPSEDSVPEAPANPQEWSNPVMPPMSTEDLSTRFTETAPSFLQASGRMASRSRHCEFYKATDGKWYMELADREYGEQRDATTYGPFLTQEAADDYLRDNFSNPGGSYIDRSGKRETPMKSPNGDPVEKPKRRMWGTDMNSVTRELVMVAKSLMAEGEIEDFIRELKSGEYKYMAFYPGKTRPGMHPNRIVDIPAHISDDFEAQVRAVIVQLRKLDKTPDYMSLTFVGTAGRTDTYVLAKRPIQEIFQGVAVPRPRVTQIADSVKEKLMEKGLHSLGTRYGKSGEQFGIQGGARMIAVGGRDFLLNTFMVSIDNEFSLRKPDTGWRLKKAVLLSQLKDEFIDAAVDWVKKGKTMQEVRDAAREEYMKKSLETPGERNYAVMFG